MNLRTQLRLRVVYDPLEGLVFDARTHELLPLHRKGGRNGKHYRAVTIDGVSYYVHRLAHFLVTGVWPVRVDHRDLDRSNNCWSNLRPATDQENKRNVAQYKNNKSGFKWVTWHVATGLWRACMTVDKKHLNLGYFKTAEAAYEVACAKARELHGQFVRI